VSWDETEKAWLLLDPGDKSAAVAALPAFRQWISRQSNDHTTLHAVRYLSTKRFKDHVAVSKKARTEKPQIQVFVGTAEWIAWTKHRGKCPPQTDLKKDGRLTGRGWLFPTQWPPTHETGSAQ
jgi:hypothetical protein